ncbi:hypothetical protein RJ639_026851 [Escallonia herrerae]|uniref:BURP domain-containing protein n=1 Tax=Escallonia herrerae TaxID=1293975 RepID=A0AA89BEU3_9ASTE|nr:hypothetical protein RJ639_026851 [Escallonia herrerae]
MEETLRQCEFESTKGETKFCATSLESMLDSAREILGFETQFKVLTTITYFTKPTTLLQNYTILEVPRDISVPKANQSSYKVDVTLYGPLTAPTGAMCKVLVQDMLSSTNLEAGYNLRKDEISKTTRDLYSKIGTPMDMCRHEHASCGGARALPIGIKYKQN